MLRAEQRLGALDGLGFNLVDELLALVVALARIAFGILVGVGKASINAVVNLSVFVLGINVLLTKLLLA